jgi:hypothetical protein
MPFRNGQCQELLRASFKGSIRATFVSLVVNVIARLWGPLPYLASAQQELICSGGTFGCPLFVETSPAFGPFAFRRNYTGFTADQQATDIFGLLTGHY